MKRDVVSIPCNQLQIHQWGLEITGEYLFLHSFYVLFVQFFFLFNHRQRPTYQYVEEINIKQGEGAK